jgi:plastocyanin
MISNVIMAYSQSPTKKPTSHGVKIHTPRLGDKVSIAVNNFTITGRSGDNQSSDCQVFVIVNDIKPYQKASAIGLNGGDDFSQWKYALFPDYVKLKIGTNKITAKIDCKNPMDMLRYDTINIMGTKAYDLEHDTSPRTEDISRVEKNASLDIGNLAAERSTQSHNLLNTTINDKNLPPSHSNLSSSRADSYNGEAQNIYSDKKMTFSSSVKYLVILIPNEGHESTNQPKNQLPLINQPYVPQNAIIEKGTSIIWLNADVGHRHKISLNDSNSEKIFDSRFFKYNTTSNEIRLNETGTYKYWESDVSKEVPDFVMLGTITVSSQEQHNATTVSQNKDDIVGTFMVPARFLDKYRSEFEDRGFTIDSTYTYKDLRGGQKGTGPEQTLIVWKVHNVPLKKVVRDLEELTSTLPYN